MDRNYAGVQQPAMPLTRVLNRATHSPIKGVSHPLPTPVTPITGDPSGMSGCQRGTFFTVAIGPG